MSEDSTYYYQITYEDFEKLMRKWIERGRYTVLFYMNMLANCREIINIPEEGLKSAIGSYVCERYRRKLFESLEDLLDNMDMLYLVQSMKEDYVFYVDQYGTPTAFYLPEEFRKKFKK